MKTQRFIIYPALILLLIGFAGFSFLNFSDDPFIARLKLNITSFYTNKPWEKVYLHIDKPFYKPGEEIWFKIYLTEGTINTPSAISDIVYVELINPKGSVEKRLTVQTTQGIGFGSFAIDESAPGGIYKVKAYSNWMKNFGMDYIFEKDITVQKIVYPRLLCKLDYKKENYAPGDSVLADLTVETLENTPLAFKDITVSIMLNGVLHNSFNITSDYQGKALINFNLPKTLKSNDGLVNVKIVHEGNTEAISRSIPIVLNNISVQFFPEGGYMVANVPGKVAFKAINEFGKPTDIKGFITDDHDRIITSFESFHQGMGAFMLTPKKGTQYKARITKPDIHETYELPLVAPNGYSMLVTPKENNTYEVLFYTPKAEAIHLVIQSGNAVQFSRTIETDKGENRLTFNADKFPVGLGLITIFDYDGMPRCERLMYFNYTRNMGISLNFDKEKYAPREKVTLKIRTLDADSIPLPANLSLAVVNDQLFTFANDKQDNILSWLMLGSEVKGKIEEPSFYFKHDEPKAEKALDYLLLTQGWRRYKWYQVTGKMFEIFYFPEKVGNISGRVSNKLTGDPVKAEVIAIELQNKKRVIKVQTGKDGRFNFIGADASSAIQIIASSDRVDADKLNIEIGKENQQFAEIITNPVFYDPKLLPDVIKINVNEKSKIKGNVGNEPIEIGTETEGVNLTPDVKRLDEVVVIGYGTVRKSDITGSISLVYPKSVTNIPENVSRALQGRVSGIEITNQAGMPGSPAQIKIRGTNSISNNNNPLYVIDGVVYDPMNNGGLSITEILPVKHIRNIEILKDAGSTSIYGSRGANGVICITTDQKYGYYKSIKRNITPQYSGVIIPQRNISYTKEFYYPVYEKGEIPEVREDFRSTIYWNPNINTDRAGEAKVEFYNSDEVTSFRAIVEGIGQNGTIGRTEKKYFTQMPFSMAVKFPSYLTFNDTVNMPLIIKNNTDNMLKGKLSYIIPKGLTAIKTLPDRITVEPKAAFTLYIPFTVEHFAGMDTLSIAFNSDKYQDAFKQIIDIQPKGFPCKLSVSGRSKEKNFSFSINKPVAGSITGNLVIYPTILSDMMAGIESIIREPYGCFEQTSSSTYPNILALEFIRETGTQNIEIEKKAWDYIDKGYKRLIGFETREHGFEWFGNTPAHEGLTAYGLMEFTDMKAVYNKVDEQMINRTINWLLSKKDGKGGFKRSYHGYGFGTASNEVNNAYIVYALSEAGIGNCEPEYKRAYEEAILSKDPYRLALLANAAYNLKFDTEGEILINKMNDQLQLKFWDEITVDHSITRSYGKSLKVETASLCIMAMLKAKQPDWGLIDKSLNYIISSRSYGNFGSTQATVLALKALKEAVKLSKPTAENGNISVEINGTTAANYRFGKGDRGKIILGGLDRFLKEGNNDVVIRYTNTYSPLPFSFDVNWNSLTPTSDDMCKVDLKTSLDKSNTKMGETVRLNVEIKNKSEEGLPMTLAIIGIPSGLSVQPWQLKEFKEKGLFDFYEITKNYLVLYYRQMNPSESKGLKFDLKTEIPGTYQAQASVAYLYYTNEFKDWEDGEEIKISE